ncbi:AraC family transcriptional regulator [Segatella buccae]|uniref:AraC family transcriptional regulator n=1 Tax=Segatella buccae TaxID=28126 RepID=UPI00215152EE|nr:two-component regulator propeller domain-containing protein [Segatella buccae]
MRRWMVTLLCLCCCGWLCAQSEARADMLVTHYTEHDGLANNGVHCALKSHDGFVWFGTWYGLSRFDGRRFQNYSTAFAEGSDQPPRKVERLVEDGQGNLWIKTTDWKVSVLFKRTERFEMVHDELKPYTRNLQVIKMQGDGRGGVLLLTKDKNLLLATTTRDGRILVRLVASSKGLLNPSDFRLKAPVVDIRGDYAAWVGTDYKIFAEPLPKHYRPESYNRDHWRTCFARKAAAADTYRDRRGNTWRLDDTGRSLTVSNVSTGFSRRYAFTLLGDITQPRFCDAGEHGVFYLTAAGEALHIDARTMEAERISTMKEVADNRADSRYFDMELDRDGVLWLTTTNNGVFRFIFPPRQFRLIHLPMSANDGVRSLRQLPSGDVWVGTRGKNLYVLDAAGRVKANLSYAVYGIGSVYYIMPDGHGRLWLSTKGDGLVEAVPDAGQPSGYRFVHYRHDPANPASISGDNVYITYKDRLGHIRVGTLDGGLNLISKRAGRVEFLNKYNGIAGYPGYGLYMEVRNMTEDRNGRLWIGTIDGLMSLDTHFRRAADIRFDTYRRTELNTLANSDIYALYKDSRQQIWVCTFGGGLSRISGYDPVNRLPLFRTVGRREGLQNDVIVSIVEDRKGRLWLGSTDGLSCFDRQAGRIRNFDRTDGFPRVEMEETASLLNRTGEVWMGCKEGILAFRPESLKSDEGRCPVYIVGCEVNNMELHALPGRGGAVGALPYVSELELRHNQNMFTLEFAALNYKSQEHLNYRYRLEGFDKAWHYSGRNRIASYTNVPPGNYRFVVEVVDAARGGHTSGRSLRIVIRPPWWATWWAYTLYALLGGVLLWLAVRYARYQIRLRNDVYVQSKLSEFKRKFYLEQQDARFVEQVKTIVGGNLDNPDFDIAAIAKELGMSRSAFFKRVKAATGMSPLDFVRDYKLTHAVELLKSSDRSITDVAYCCGFSDVGYFGKCFRKKYGMSPRAFAVKSRVAT